MKSLIAPTLAIFFCLLWQVSVAAKPNFESKNHYEVLGVKSTDSKKDIRTAWRKLVKEYHPDVVAEGERNRSAALLRKLNEAWDWINEHHGTAGAQPSSESENWDSSFDQKTRSAWEVFWTETAPNTSDSTELSIRLSSYIFTVKDVYTSEHGTVFHVRNPTNSIEDVYLPKWYWLPNGSQKLYSVPGNITREYSEDDVIKILNGTMFDPRNSTVMHPIRIEEGNPNVISFGGVEFTKMSEQEKYPYIERLYAYRPEVVIQDQKVRNTWEYHVYNDALNPGSYIVFASSMDALRDTSTRFWQAKIWMGKPGEMSEYKVDPIEGRHGQFFRVNGNLFGVFTSHFERNVLSREYRFEGWLDQGSRDHDLWMYSERAITDSFAAIDYLDVDQEALIGKRLSEEQYRNIVLSDLLRPDQLPKVADISTPMDHLFQTLALEGGSGNSHPLFGRPIDCTKALGKD